MERNRRTTAQYSKESSVDLNCTENMERSMHENMWTKTCMWTKTVVGVQCGRFMFMRHEVVRHRTKDSFYLTRGRNQQKTLGFNIG